MLTATAYDLQLGDIVADILAMWIPLPPARHFAIAASVAEATSNAIVHGNLAISNRNRGCFEGLAHLEREVSRGLADPLKRARRCEIRMRWNAVCLFVRVSDSGDGFVAASTGGDPSAPFGRGRQIIAALASAHRYMRGGRTLMLRFAR